MACVVITLPNQQVLTFSFPNGGQIVPVSIRDCQCGCEEWFVPAESTQRFVNPQHQQRFANRMRLRKTERRQKAS